MTTPETGAAAHNAPGPASASASSSEPASNEATRPGETSFVVGVGAVSGYGWGEKYLREGLYTSTPAVRRFGGRWVGAVPDGGDPTDGPALAARAARFAAREATADARQRGWRQGGSAALVLAGAGWPAHRVEGRTVRSSLPQHIAAEITAEFDFHGPTLALDVEGSSGAAALVLATQWLQTGVADDVLVVACDLTGRFGGLDGIAGSDTGGPAVESGPLITDTAPGETCRPFQDGSRGANPGEAAVAMLLSRRRDAPYASVLGGSTTSGATKADTGAPDALQARVVIESALGLAGTAPGEIAYVNTEGIGTPDADRLESAAIDGAVPETKGIFSMKPMVGHCGGASAAMELLATLYGFETSVIPAPPRLARGHPRLLDGLTAAEEGPVLKVAFGRLGDHSALVLAPART